MADINQELQNILDAQYGEEVRTSIHDAIEHCYGDAGNLAQENLTAAANANQAAQRADQAAAAANESSAQADAAAVHTSNIGKSTELLKADLQEKLENGYFKGEKGDQGDKGDQGESGVSAPSSGMFTLKLDSATGNLYAVYPEGEEAPNFRYDNETGNLYYVIEEE